MLALQAAPGNAQDEAQRCGTLPAPVAEKRAAILAAAEGSLEDLAALTAPDFTASYGGGGALEIWQELAEQGTDVRVIVKTLLGIDCAVAHQDDMAYFTWPAANDLPWDQLDVAEREALAPLYGGDLTNAYLEGPEVGYYVGWAMTLTGAGEWIALVAGD